MKHGQRRADGAGRAQLQELAHPGDRVVPGGPGEVDVRAGGATLEWLRSAHRDQHLDHVGVYRLADPGRRGAAGRQARHLPLAGLES